MLIKVRVYACEHLRFSDVVRLRGVMVVVVNGSERCLLVRTTKIDEGRSV